MRSGLLEHAEARESAQQPIERRWIDAEGRRKLVATPRAIPEEVGDAEHGGHVNQLRHQRAPQELTQPG
jgi:hypothetical protein